MRRRPFDRDQRGRLEVKMTPMIDVIFLLLIFFVCTASFQAPEEVLPTSVLWMQAGSGETERPIDPEIVDLDEIVVKIIWRGSRASWQITGRDYESLGEVAAVLRSIARFKNDLPVVVDPQGDVPIENAIDVYDLCRRIGLAKVRFAASGEL